MESKFLIYTLPADTSREPIGSVTAGTLEHAQRKVARILKLGYSLRLVRT